MIPKPVYNGEASALFDLVNSETAPDIDKVEELIDAVKRLTEERDRLLALSSDATAER